MGDLLQNYRSVTQFEMLGNPTKKGGYSFVVPAFLQVDVAEGHLLPGMQDVEEPMKLKRTRLAPGSSESTVMIARPHY